MAHVSDRSSRPTHTEPLSQSTTMAYYRIPLYTFSHRLAKLENRVGGIWGKVIRHVSCIHISEVYEVFKDSCTGWIPITEPPLLGRQTTRDVGFEIARCIQVASSSITIDGEALGSVASGTFQGAVYPQETGNERQNWNKILLPVDAILHLHSTIAFLLFGRDKLSPYLFGTIAMVHPFYDFSETFLF